MTAPAERTGLLLRIPDRPAAGTPPETVVMIHPGAIPLSHYRELSDGLAPTRELVLVDLEQVPEYFQAALTRGRATITVEEIAARVAEALRNSPVIGAAWVLAGWSFGGVISHALLDALDDGEGPELVVVLDALAPVPEFTAVDGALDRFAVLGWFAMYLAAKRGGTVTVTERELRAGDVEHGLEVVLRAAVAGGALRPGTGVAGLRKVFLAYHDGLLRNNELVATYRPHRTTTPLVLLRPAHGLVDRPGALGWDQLTPSPRVLHTPGDHYTMLRHPEAVRRFAEVPTAAAQHP